MTSLCYSTCAAGRLGCLGNGFQLKTSALEAVPRQHIVGAWNYSEISRRGHWKRGICIKWSKIDLRQICDNFAHPSCDVRNEMQDILLKSSAQFATNLHNAPLAKAPLSEFPNYPPGTNCYTRLCCSRLSLQQLDALTLTLHIVVPRDWNSLHIHLLISKAYEIDHTYTYTSLFQSKKE